MSSTSHTRSWDAGIGSNHYPILVPPAVSSQSSAHLQNGTRPAPLFDANLAPMAQQQNDCATAQLEDNELAALERLLIRAQEDVARESREAVRSLRERSRVLLGLAPDPPAVAPAAVDSPALGQQDGQRLHADTHSHNKGASHSESQAAPTRAFTACRSTDTPLLGDEQAMKRAGERVDAEAEEIKRRARALAGLKTKLAGKTAAHDKNVHSRSNPNSHRTGVQPPSLPPAYASSGGHVEARRGVSSASTQQQIQGQDEGRTARLFSAQGGSVPSRAHRTFGGKDAANLPTRDTQAGDQGSGDAQQADPAAAILLRHLPPSVRLKYGLDDVGFAALGRNDMNAQMSLLEKYSDTGGMQGRRHLTEEAPERDGEVHADARLEQAPPSSASKDVLSRVTRLTTDTRGGVQGVQQAMSDAGVRRLPTQGASSKRRSVAAAGISRIPRAAAGRPSSGGVHRPLPSISPMGVPSPSPATGTIHEQDAPPRIMVNKQAHRTGAGTLSANPPMALTAAVHVPIPAPAAPPTRPPSHRHPSAVPAPVPARAHTRQQYDLGDGSTSISGLSADSFIGSSAFVPVDSARTRASVASNAAASTLTAAHGIRRRGGKR